MRRVSIELAGFEHANPIPVASRKGPFVFSSGFTGRDAESRVMPPTLAEQMANIFRHVRALMQAVSASPEDIMKMTFWLADVRDRTALNEQWLTLFPNPSNRPARQVLKAQFDSDVLVQADLVAVLDDCGGQPGDDGNSSP